MAKRTYEIPGNKYLWTMHRNSTKYIRVWLAAESEVDFFVLDTINFHRFENKLPCHALLRGRKTVIPNQLLEINAASAWYTIIGNFHPYVLTCSFEITPVSEIEKMFSTEQSVKPTHGVPVDLGSSEPMIAE